MNYTLVTGGMGFIGKFLVRKILSETDENIVIVDNLSSSVVDPAISDNPRVTFFNQSFEDFVVPATMHFNKIYHLTSPVGPLGVLKYKGLIGEMIITQLYKAAFLAIEHSAKLIEISTSEVYGAHPKDEAEGQRETLEMIVPSDYTVRLEYGIGKLLCEVVLSNLARDNELNYVCIRPFNIVGPQQNGDLGFIIPRFIKQLDEDAPLTVYGDGSQKRTFTHVQDFVDATFLLMQNDVPHRIYNIGNPSNVTSIKALAERMVELAGKGSISFVDPTSLFKDFAEAWNKIPNIDRLKADTGFEPKFTLDMIITEAMSNAGY